MLQKLCPRIEKGMMNKVEQQLLNRIADMLREAYPDAVAVEIFVNHHEASIRKKYRHKLDGISMRSLSGNWVRE